MSRVVLRGWPYEETVLLEIHHSLVQFKNVILQLVILRGDNEIAPLEWIVPLLAWMTIFCRVICMAAKDR